MKPEQKYDVGLKILGKFSLTDDKGDPIDLPSAKVQALLAFLALNPNQHHSRSKLATLLWSRHDDEHARNNLSQSLYRLRRALTPYADRIIETDREGVTLNSDAIAVDVLALRRLAGDDSPTALRQAADLCADGLLEDFEIREEGFGEWLAREREAVAGLATELLTRLAEAQLDACKTDSAITTAARLVSRDPLNEGSHRLLMRANLGAGRRNAALQQYHRCGELLQRELGVEPEAATKALYEEICGGRMVAAIATQLKTNFVVHVPRESALQNGECTKLSDKPSIAVLAFQNLSGDPEQDCFADGIAENVIMLLSHFHSLFVVASSSSFTFKGQTVDVTQVAKLLSVRYVVQGSVRKAGNRVRITAQLIDTTSGKHLWADRFDGGLNDVFDLQVQITEQIVVAVEPETTRLLEGTKLGRGAHHSRERGMCAMELVAYIAGEEHSYAPACASELLTGFTIRLNDAMRQAERENLKPFLPRLVGTNQGDERRRFEAMTRTMIVRLLVPILERRGAPLLAARLRQRSLTSLGSLALWLRVQKGDTDLRLDVVLPRNIRQALWNAVNAADRVRDGSQPNWNWCGGELGITVTDAIHLTGDENWAVALQTLEAGIDACSVNQFGTSSRPNDGSDLTRAAQYVCI